MCISDYIDRNEMIMIKNLINHVIHDIQIQKNIKIPLNFLNFRIITSLNTPEYSWVRKMSDNSSEATSSHNSTEATNNVKTNKLILEKSPYLLQHAMNPVDWYPWGKEAFEKAQKENKVIFLSVGYSTCHW